MSHASSPACQVADNAGFPREATSRSRRSGVQCLSYAYPTINAILYSSYANILLVFVPFSITTGALGWNSAVVFISNFLAIFPLAALLLYSTEELLKTPRDTFGGFINTTFGNAVEIIVGITALSRGEIRIVQSSI